MGSRLSGASLLSAIQKAQTNSPQHQRKTGKMKAQEPPAHPAGRNKEKPIILWS